MKRRLLAASTLALAGVLGMTGSALAMWTVSSSGASGSTAADTLAAAQTVTTSGVTATNVTINVIDKPTTGPTPSGYRVARTAPTSASSVCSISGSTGSCSDSSPGAGQTNTYAVYSLLGTNWVSSTSATTSVAVPSSDTTAPSLLSLAMQDTNSNGKVDHVVATFNETLAPYTAGTAPWTLTNVPSAGSLFSVSVSGSAATLTLTEGASAASTAVGSFKVALAASATGIRDASGNQSSFAATAPTDAAPPARISMQMKDTNADGKIDQVVAAFSESLAGYTASTGPWTLANVPSGGTLSSVAASGTSATLTISPGAGAADTSVGSFTIAMATNANGVRDAAGNQASFVATAPSDAAGPVPVSFTDANGTTDGKFEPGDSFTVTYSETVVTSWTAPDSTQNLVLTDASPRDTIAFPTKFGSAAALDTGDNSYISNGTATFATTLTQPTSNSLRVTLGTCSGTGCSSLGTGGLHAFTFAPSSTAISDAAANAAAGSVSNPSFRLF